MFYIYKKKCLMFRTLELGCSRLIVNLNVWDVLCQIENHIFLKLMVPLRTLPTCGFAK